MKKIISIAFAAILAGLAISCQKEEAVSDKTDAVQYTFNITVADQVGFDSEVSTKKAGPGPSYKSDWGNGDRIFLFFKPTSGSLLTDTYATLTYNESSWSGAFNTDTPSLGNGGTLSAVYVYNPDGSVTPAYSDNKWTIATGNTFYNCQTGVDYTVSGSEISASLNLEAPDDFVRFTVYGTDDKLLTCNKVKGWKDVVIGSEMTFSNATCTGYMTGFNNIGQSSYKDYYGRIVGGGTTLKNVACNFSVVKDGKVYERSATPSSDARSFKMTVSTPDWTEAAGKLPGLFTVGEGADGTAGTADDVQVRFSQGNLYAKNESGAWKWHFYDEQYKYNSLSTGSARSAKTYDTEIDLFTWGYSASTSLDPTGQSYVEAHTTDRDKLLVYDKASSNGGDDWGVAYCESNEIAVGTWRTLSTNEWQYLFNTRTMANGGARSENLTSSGITVEDVLFKGVVLFPDNFTNQADWKTKYTTWKALNDAGIIFLPAAGDRRRNGVSHVGDDGSYWSSTALGGDSAYNVSFSSSFVTPDDYDDRNYGYSVRLVTESN